MYKHALKRYPFSQSVSHAFTKCQLFAPLVARRSIELHSGGITLDFQPGGQSSTQKSPNLTKRPNFTFHKQCKLLQKLITKDHNFPHDHDYHNHHNHHRRYHHHAIGAPLHCDVNTMAGVCNSRSICILPTSLSSSSSSSSS